MSNPYTDPVEVQKWGVRAARAIARIFGGAYRNGNELKICYALVREGTNMLKHRKYNQTTRKARIRNGMDLSSGRASTIQSDRVESEPGVCEPNGEATK